MSDHLEILRATTIHSLRLMQDRVRDMSDDELMQFCTGQDLGTCVCVNGWEFCNAEGLYPLRFLRLKLNCRA